MNCTDFSQNNTFYLIMTWKKISEYFKSFKYHFVPILNLTNLLFYPRSARIMKVERTEYYYLSTCKKAVATERAEVLMDIHQVRDKT